MAATAQRQKFKFMLDVKALKKEDKTNKVMVEIWHNEGGMSILAGTSSNRAITCSVTPLEEQGNGIMILMLTHGLRYPLENVKRRNDKKMEAWLAFVRDEVDRKTGRAWDVLQEVLKRYELQLKCKEGNCLNEIKGDKAVCRICGTIYPHSHNL